MIVEPSLMDHPKFIQFKTLVGAAALEYLVRLWGHCQQKMRGQFWRGATPAYVEIVCSGRINANLPIYDALKECRWIEEREGGVEIHDWAWHNASLVSRWQRSEQEAARRAVHTPAHITSEPPAQPPAQTLRRPLLIAGGEGSRVDKSTGGENKGSCARRNGVREREMRTQFAALRDEITALDKRREDLTASEREDLRKKRGILRGIQRKQAAGEF